MQPRPFRDRRQAGRQLAAKLAAYANRPDVIVLALPRGGVPVGYEVAQALGAPLDVFVVRKLGVPGYEELAMGAIATGGVRVLNEVLIQQLGVPEYIVDAGAARELEELKRREHLYRGAERSGGFLCLGMGLSFHFPNDARTASDSQKWHDINREKGEQQKRK